MPLYATVALDVSELLPEVHWPAQIELRAGRYVVRPRYEVIRDGRAHIAHVNVERADLQPDPAIPALAAQLGRGYLLPFPVLPRDHFRTIVQPTPMATTQRSLPLRVDVFERDGSPVASHFVGCLKRDHAFAVDLDEILVRSRAQRSAAMPSWPMISVTVARRTAGCMLIRITRIGAPATWRRPVSGSHIFNTLMTYKDEPQSYSGSSNPRALLTRLFLKLGQGRRRSFAVLIYPASVQWRPAFGNQPVVARW